MKATKILNIILVGLVVAISLFLLYPILSNYRKEHRCRKVYKMYGKYYR